MSLGRSPCDSLVLKEDKSSDKVANFNNLSMCVYAAILNRLWSVMSDHTRFCQFKNTRFCQFKNTTLAFGSDMGAVIFGYGLHGGVCL